MESWREYIQPGLSILVPVLYFVGTWLKKATWFADRYIPALLGALGVGLALLYVFGTCVVQTQAQVLQAVFTALTQGLCCAGVSVYANQLVKQSHKKE